jgi:hypothetical protein
MAYNKKPMSENEKKAKLKVLKDAHGMASKAMSESLSGVKDSPELKKHVKQMSSESGIDFKGDSDKIVDPQHYGNVIGRHISDENIDCEKEPSVYDIDEQIQMLMREILI